MVREVTGYEGFLSSARFIDDDNIITGSGMDHSLLFYTGCLLISGACLGIYNLLIFWSLRAEILNTLTSKVYKFIHLIRQIKSSSKHNQIAICIFWQI